MKKRFTEEQIIKVLNRQEAGEKSKDLCRELGIHEQTLYVWKKKYAGMGISEARRLRELEAENAKLKKMLANAMIDIDDLKAINAKNW